MDRQQVLSDSFAMELRPNKEDFGEAIRALRKAKDITQETLAADTGMAASNLSLLESGTRQPNLDKIVKRASALETEPSELLRLAEAHAAGQLALEVTVKPK